MSILTSSLDRGDAFRDLLATLLRSRYDAVRTEVQLTAKKADILFSISLGPRRALRVAAECKDYARALTRDDTRDIIADYEASKRLNEFDDLWIITRKTPAPGSIQYASAFPHVQVLSFQELEQNIIDFSSMLRSLISDYEADVLSKYYIRPRYETDSDPAPLDARVEAWLARPVGRPIAIWAGYGMGKTSFARYLAAKLAKAYQSDPHSLIPILIPLGELHTAPNMDGLISKQLLSAYDVKNFSFSAFNELNKQTASMK
jgi:hypothetical protein